MWFTVLKYIFNLAPHVVLGIETLQGDQASGATKKQMATDMLNVATQAAVGVTTGQDQAMAQIASQIASIAIDQAVDVSRASGAYAKATAIANAVNVAGQVVSSIEPVAVQPVTENPTPVVETSSISNPAPQTSAVL